MMGWQTPFSGEIRAEVVSADLPGLLRQFSREGILLRNLRPVDPLTVCVTLDRTDWKKVKQLTRKRGADLRLIRRNGLYWHGKQLLKRPVLLFGLGVFAALSLWLPTRVLFVNVEGNQSIPTRLILEKAETCGIGFGASRKKVRSEKMKNTLLEAMPGLEWAGVNTTGCTAVISVREGEKQEGIPENPVISSLVAVRDGIVESYTAAAGTALCTVGQAVQKGQLLISGYTDCGITVRAQRAVGEVFGRTVRQWTAVTPTKYAGKGQVRKEVKNISLILGKKRINLWKDSGIYGMTCDKMYEEYCIVLPGGFRLPVAVAVERWRIRETGTLDWTVSEPRVLAEEQAMLYLLQQMISGRILDAYLQEDIRDRILYLTGSCVCTEMIARERSEEIFEQYGKSD